MLPRMCAPRLAHPSHLFTPCRQALLCVAGLAVGMSAAALEPSAPGSPAPSSSLEAASGWDYQLGLALSDGPSYVGAQDHQLSAKPVWSVRLGRFRFTSSRVGLVEKAGSGDAVVPGASMELGGNQRWRFEAALRLDNGRDAGDSPRLQGFEDVPATLRGRLSAHYLLSPGWRAELSLASDLLSRGGGTTAGLGLHHRMALAPGWRWTAGVDLTAADATFLRSYHGVSPAASSASGLPEFRPGAGWHQVMLGTGLTWQFAPHWRLGGALQWSQLIGPAADSPLTLQRQGLTATLGLVYASRPLPAAGEARN